MFMSAKNVNIVCGERCKVKKLILVLVAFVYSMPLTMAGDWNDRDDISKESEEVAQEGTGWSWYRLDTIEGLKLSTDANIIYEKASEYIIKIGDKSDKARPAFRFIPLTEELYGWVNEEGKELEVVISFIVEPDDGRISHLNIDESSGNKDLDNAIAKTFRKWRLADTTGKDRILGTFTYRVKPNDGD